MTNDWIDMVTGVRRRTLVSGHTMMQMLVAFTAGAKLPEHQHPHEQISHVLTGRVRFLLDGGKDIRELGPTDAIYLPANLPHAAEAIDDAEVIDTFSPPREDLLAQDKRQAAAANTTGR